MYQADVLDEGDDLPQVHNEFAAVVLGDLSDVLTRCGISAKQLEREINRRDLKTAHRMFKQIRTLLLEDDELLDGQVEMDETAGGGKVRASDTRRGFIT